MKPGLKHRLCVDIAKERDIPVEQVLQIVESQFSFVEHVISSPGYDAVNLMYLGKFKVHPWRVKKLSEKKAIERQKKHVKNYPYGTFQTRKQLQNTN